MQQESKHAEHLGRFIRNQVIPAGMSVTEAAKRLGVGRPALSNLLNGNSSLSPRMAVLLEETFDANRQELLRRQAEFDRGQREASISVPAYVPPFLAIRATQIDAWANGIEARHFLPVLLRMLVISTHKGLARVAFPGYDDAQRHGWDGLVEADSVTPWIPNGLSCWEFGTNRNPGYKADDDYRRALKRSVPFAARQDATFVFVTPRRWLHATEWAAAREREGRWRAVRAFDASDLETWLSQSIPAQTWLAEELGMATKGVETLDRFWERWSSASNPAMTEAVFRASIEAYRDDVEKWLASTPERPLVLAADSRDEAIGFLACCLRNLRDGRDDSVVTRSVDLAAIFDSSSTLRTLASSRTRFLPIVRNEECERELAPIHRRLHCITVRPRNDVQSEPDIALDLLHHEAFKEALDSMGVDPNRVDRLERESGRSPTILRRRLSPIGAIQAPPWAANDATAKKLIPMTLIGAWNGKSSADQDILAKLADKPYPEIERDITQLLRLDDSPVWAAGQHRGIASKMDALFAIRERFTGADLEGFFTLAHYVLSEMDPALELPEDRRWTAGAYGKVRNHSAALRRGVCETLVILSVHGNDLFREWLGVEVEAHVSALIQTLLAPLTSEKLLSHNDDLPRYAEAAPNTFLQVVEEDLRQSSPAVFAMLRPVEAGILGGSPRTGVLWALECLGWRHPGQVCEILGRLSRTAIDDNWVHKPINSLKAIFSSWLPQTSASLEERVRGLKALVDRYPDVGWQVCVDQLPVGRGQVGHTSYRPRWRSDATSAGRGVTNRERWRFIRCVLDMIDDWPNLDVHKLGNLVDRILWLPTDYQARVWGRVVSWGQSEADDRAKALLRERIRRGYLTRFGQFGGLSAMVIESARKAYESLKPRDLVIRHQWLFADHWIEPSAEHLEASDPSFTDRQEAIRGLRKQAIVEIWEGKRFEGVTALLDVGANGDIVGFSLANVISERDAKTGFLRRCLHPPEGPVGALDACVQGFLRALTEEERGPLVSALIESFDSQTTGRLLLCAPFRWHTWRQVARCGAEVADQYWEEVVPQWESHDERELMELIDRLMDAKRPYAAFWVANRDWSLVETSRLKRLLLAVATTKPGPTDHYPLKAYDISRALESLDGRTGVSVEDMASLEFLYISVLDDEEHGVPNLEEQIASSAMLFFQALALAFGRRDKGEDPPDWRIDDRKRAVTVAQSAQRLLHRVSRLPGTHEEGIVDLEALVSWITEVRGLCAQHDRIAVGDEMIGQLLSRIDPVSEDTPWPRAEVCEVLERTASTKMGLGFRVGVYNSRGVHIGADHGGPERRLSARFRKIARQHTFTYPFVASLLEEIASGYDDEAKWHDTQGEVRKRLR